MKFRIKVFTYGEVFEYIVEAENKKKARYKAFKDAKASAITAADAGTSKE